MKRSNESKVRQWEEAYTVDVAKLRDRIEELEAKLHYTELQLSLVTPNWEKFPKADGYIVHTFYIAKERQISPKRVWRMNKEE